MAAVGVAAVLLLAIGFDAPLEGPANPGLSPNPTKAPWYFVGIQELLMHFHPVFAILVIPLALLAGLACLPFIRYEADTSGLWFVSGKGRALSLAAAALAIVLTVGGVLLDEYLLPTRIPGFVSSGLLPFNAHNATSGCISRIGGCPAARRRKRSTSRIFGTIPQHWREILRPVSYWLAAQAAA